MEGVKQTRRYFYIPGIPFNVIWPSAYKSNPSSGSARLYCETIRDRGSKPSVFEQVTTNVTEIQALADRFAATDEQNGSRVVDNDNINNGGDDAEDKGEQNQADTSTKDQQGEAAAKPSRRRRSQPAQGSAVKRVARKAERELAELLRSFVIPEQISLQRRRERWSKKQMQLGRLLGTVNNNLSNQQAAAELSQSGAERRTAIIGSLDGGRSRRNRPQVQVRFPSGELNISILILINCLQSILISSCLLPGALKMTVAKMKILMMEAVNGSNNVYLDEVLDVRHVWD